MTSLDYEEIGSEFEYSTGLTQKDDLSSKPTSSKIKKPDKSDFFEERSREEGRRTRNLTLDAYSRHKQLINEYFLSYPGKTNKFKRDTTNDRTDLDVIKGEHQFVWRHSDEPKTWGKRLAKKYYDKLHKEYAISDLSRFRENKIALRWRTEAELVDGKGQFSCGDKHCQRNDDLASWEVNFSYIEHGIKENALVKLRLCPQCSIKLNFNKRKKRIEKLKRKRKTSEEDKPIAKEIKKEEQDNWVEKTHAREITKQEPNSPPTKESDEQANDNRIWKQSVELEEDKSRDHEFEDYLDDLLL